MILQHAHAILSSIGGEGLLFIAGAIVVAIDDLRQSRILR